MFFLFMHPTLSINSRSCSPRPSLPPQHHLPLSAKLRDVYLSHHLPAPLKSSRAPSLLSERHVLASLHATPSQPQQVYRVTKDCRLSSVKTPIRKLKNSFYLKTEFDFHFITEVRFLSEILTVTE